MASSLLPGLHRPPAKSSFPFPFQPRKYPSPIPRTTSSPRSPIFASLSSSSSSSWEREEQRWLREEQRWLREEQRWLREESRWGAEREALLREIAALRLQIEALERDRPELEAMILAAPQNEGRSGAAPPRPALVEEAQVKEMVLEEVRLSEAVVERREEVVVEERQQQQIRRKTLRKGSEGEDVRTLQEALQSLGFYSGEEDMEFSSFSSGTERAVKTWQASLGALEDGIMTTELLETLFREQGKGGTALKDDANGAMSTSITEMTEIQQKVVRENGDAQFDVSQHRVFLLGENRWEEPSRLVGRDKPLDRRETASLTKCVSCRGEGKLMCTECDGTGEPNIEPQFLEWVDEGTKCPYCEGLGYTICDVCEGRTTVEA
ncbi:protein disulfide isomerase pTAC5, chloroplastic-like [Musa acuminata AAA Group]|uniref:protein disulfide isomerase pTAC5, chloroplastic-like n=1 Tax=Musa acuminata AAA Group TaxID=214697 RepID=UPI0031DFF76D